MNTTLLRNFKIYDLVITIFRENILPGTRNLWFQKLIKNKRKTTLFLIRTKKNSGIIIIFINSECKWAALVLQVPFYYRCRYNTVFTEIKLPKHLNITGSGNM